MEFRVVVVEVLDGACPAGVFVNLVEEEVGDAMGVEILDQFGESVAAEPDVVERGVEGLICMFFVLKSKKFFAKVRIISLQRKKFFKKVSFQGKFL